VHVFKDSKEMWDTFDITCEHYFKVKRNRLTSLSCQYKFFSM